MANSYCNTNEIGMPMRAHRGSNELKGWQFCRQMLVRVPERVSPVRRCVSREGDGRGGRKGRQHGWHCRVNRRLIGPIGHVISRVTTERELAGYLNKYCAYLAIFRCSVLCCNSHGFPS